MFEGYYYKHQKNDRTVAVIHGKADQVSFIQVITSHRSYFFKDNDECLFSEEGIKLCLPQIYGEIRYGEMTPIQYDIMGPFKFLPMECKHGIISMHHYIWGKLSIEGEIVDFDNGIGYIEKDSGTSFPSEYTWIQCNDFLYKASIVFSVAMIPFLRTKFKGLICVIIHRGAEYRFATYLGAKIIRCDANKIEIRQGRYRLEIELKEGKRHPLVAPKNSQMKIKIYESSNTEGVFRLWREGKQIFELWSRNVSYEKHSQNQTEKKGKSI